MASPMYLKGARGLLFSWKYLVHRVAGSTSWIPWAPKSDPRLNLFFLHMGLLVLQILIGLTELAPKLNFQKWHDRELDIHVWQTRWILMLYANFLYVSCHFHSLGDSGTKTKSSPKGYANRRGKRWFRIDKEKHGHRACTFCSRLAFPHPCWPPIGAETPY